MSKLVLMVSVTPFRDDKLRVMKANLSKIKDTTLRNKVSGYAKYVEKQNDANHLERTEEIAEYLVLTMMHYLTNGNIPSGSGQQSELKHASQNLVKLIRISNIIKIRNSYVFDITIDSEYASFVEFGTGLHGELSSPHYIKPKKFKFMHWVDNEGEMFLKKSAGQYPKPFMRGAAMRLQNHVELIEGYRVNTQIVWPETKFNETFEGQEVHKGEMKKYEKNAEIKDEELK